MRAPPVGDALDAFQLLDRADFTPASEPNVSSSARRREGPMPGISSSADVIVRAERRFRLNVTATRGPRRASAEQPQRGAAAWEPERVRASGQVDLLLLLRQLMNGVLAPAACAAAIAAPSCPAAVHDEQVRQRLRFRDAARH